ncbi:MAG: ABC transporter permease [Clostridiales bacterium]|nr:ABC transporter permease [Clostridiales bacterium]
MKIPRFSRKTLCIPYAVFLLFFVIIPMIVILVYAMTDKNMHFSFGNFAKFFSDPTKLSTIVYSFVIAIVTTAVCLVIAYPVALILARSKFKRKFVLLFLFVTPMWINFVLRVNAIRELLNWIGLLGEANYFNTIFGMVYDFLPFMILPLYTTLSKIDNSLYEASADLGGNAFTTFTRVTLPLSMPGIMSGVTMVFLPSMTNYVVSDMLGNSKVTIIGKFIETYFGTDWHMGSMIALILLIIVFASTALSGGFKSEDNVRGANL